MVFLSVYDFCNYSLVDAMMDTTEALGARLTLQFRVLGAQCKICRAKLDYQRAVSLVDTQAIKRTQTALRDAATELMRAEIAARDM